MSITFAQPMQAIGLEGYDMGETARLTLHFLDELDTVLDSVLVPHAYPWAPSASVLHFGYINQHQPFTKVVFESDGLSGDVFAFDYITVGQAK